MGILNAGGIRLSFGDRVLLDGVTVTLPEHGRCALVGGNGEGKSTLMKIIAGLMSCDEGTVTCTKGSVVSYLPQSDIVLRGNTVREEIISGFEGWQNKEKRKNEIEFLLGQRPEDRTLLDELAVLQEELISGPYYKREMIASSIAKGLGFSEKDLSRSCSEFSGGYQMRIALGRLLAMDPDIMLLDEPTNYLDVESVIWLKNYLKTYAGSLLIVCHDRDFLDDTVTQIYELFNAKLTRYNCNYSSYEKQRREEIEQLEKRWQKQQEEIKSTQQFIDRFRYKATKAKQVQSRIKSLEKMERVVVPSHLKTVSFAFPEPVHSPNDMVVVEKLTKSYGTNTVIENMNLYIGKGTRLAVTGHNGAGKSTLLRILAGVDRDYEGTVRFGSGIVTGYYAQDTADSLDMNGTVWDQVSSMGSDSAVRSALGAFLFQGDDIFKKVSVLSGGERSRLALLKILLKPANLLILDEPTNHLDINSKTMLLNALSSYKGTVVFVSHDTRFIRELASSILYMNAEGHELINGDYDYFEYLIAKRKGLEVGNPEPAVPLSSDWTEKTQSEKEKREQMKKLKSRQKKLNGESSELLENLEETERKLANLEDRINMPENYSVPEKINVLVREKEELLSYRNKLEQKWLEANAELEKIQAENPNL